MKFKLLGILLLLATISVLIIGCSGDSGETLIRNVVLKVSGHYTNGGGPLPGSQTGNKTTAMNVRQTGDQIEATDNNGLIFKGTIGQATETEGSFTLNGRTTAGQDVTISGTFSVPEGSTDGTMRGTWIEPSLTASFIGFATVPTNSPDSSGSSSQLIIEPALVSISTTDPIDFTATTGFSSYSFTVSDSSLGKITSVNNNKATYEAESGASGKNTITVKVSGGKTATATVVHEASELALKPQLKKLSAGATQEFTATSGFSTYTFSVADSSLGSIVEITDNKATYQATTNVGLNTITVKVNGGQTASATIEQ